MNKNFYYIVSDAKKEALLITKSFIEIFDFIVINKDSKISTIDHNRKPRILDKSDFLISYLQNVKNKSKFFELSKILIKGSNNYRHFFNTQKLLEDYINYEQSKNNAL